mmetsp:Transcript_39192/g.89075  ORF Transcript_39192/g.89075 Transcript_39192/m.89075 type:complete len:212 (+) Transcript_39192:120-755(+)
MAVLQVRVADRAEEWQVVLHQLQVHGELLGHVTRAGDVLLLQVCLEVLRAVKHGRDLLLDRLDVEAELLREERGLHPDCGLLLLVPRQYPQRLEGIQRGLGFGQIVEVGRVVAKKSLSAVDLGHCLGGASQVLLQARDLLQVVLHQAHAGLVPELRHPRLDGYEVLGDPPHVLAELLFYTLALLGQGYLTSGQEVAEVLPLHGTVDCDVVL